MSLLRRMANGKFRSRIALNRFRRRFVALLSLGGFSVALICPQAQAQVNVTTQQYDIGRTGQNLNETILNLSNVNATTFGKLFSRTVDGAVYAQPLYLSNLVINGATHNVIFVATEHDSVYAFDADSNTGANASPLWMASMLSAAHGAAAGATTAPWPAGSDIDPEVGITGTPVIDSATNTLYVVSRTVEAATGVQRLHALDVTTGAEKFGGPVVITASVPGTGQGSVAGMMSFNPGQENQRPGLLLLNGVVYIGWTAHEDIAPWHGWILGYDASNLHQTGAFCTSPNALYGSGVWMSGNGLAADRLDAVNHPFGRMFVATGNGDYTATKPYTNRMDYGDSHLNLDLTNGVPTVTDEFTTKNQAAYASGDLDVGSGGVLVLPNQPGSFPHLLVQNDKAGNVYLLNRDNLGGYNTTKNQVVQEFVANTGAWSTPAYWNSTVYLIGQFEHLKAYPLINGLLSTTSPVQSTELYGFPGATPAISANGTADAIVWSVNSSGYGKSAAVLQAHSAANVATTLYSSSTNSTRDQAGIAVKFVVPTVANGKVYVGATKEVDVYGPLNGNTPVAATPTFTPAAGTYTSAQSVTISDTTSGAKIYYTTNGTTPTTASALYSGPVTVSASETLEAIAAATGFTNSNVGVAAYAINSGGTTTVINDPTGFSSSTGLSLVKGATLTNNALQLSTAAGGVQAKAVWYTTPVNVQSFTTDFNFQLTSAVGDGFTFTLQNAAAGVNAVGQNGGGLGYQGIGSSVAVKFDLYSNAGEGNNSTGFFTNGAAPFVPAADLTASGVNLHSGDTMHAHITYNGTTLTLTLTDTVTNATFTTSTAINIPATVGANTAYAGFTAGTAGYTANQSILNWTYVVGSGTTAPVAATPTFTPAAGTYTSAQSVTISDTTSGAKIYYTTNGTTPTTASALYSGPVTVSASETLEAIAAATGFTNSNVGVAAYAINSGGTTTVINDPTGFSSSTGLSLVKGATLTNNALQLSTAAGGVQAKAVWYTTPVNVQSFTTDFNFQLTSAVGDGFTFTLQNAAAGVNAVGQNGGGLGYQGIGSSVAVKFDLYSNAGEGNNSTGFFTNGAAPFVPAADLTASGVNLHSGDTMHAHITYNGTTLTLTLTDTVTNATFTTSTAINIPATVGANTAYAGFTAGTAGYTANQSILNWTYAVGSTSTGPVINDPTGFSSSTGLSLVKGATLTNNALQLSTAAGGVQAKAVWYTTPVNVQSFTTDFNFQLTSAVGDGFTFTLQNAAAGVNAVGQNGGGLGYQGIGSSVAVKFDLYSNAGEGNNSTGFFTNGAAPFVPAADLTASGVNLHSGDTMHAHITYNGTTLTLTLTDTVTNATFTTSTAINIPATVGANTAYAGFTAGTAGYTANQSILNWTYAVN